MPTDEEFQPGQIVWAKISKKAEPWAEVLENRDESNIILPTDDHDPVYVDEEYEVINNENRCLQQIHSLAIIISVEKMNLVYFKDRPGKTCVWWLSADSMSQLNNNLIFEFKSYFTTFTAVLNKSRKRSIEQAMHILSTQYNFVLPEHNMVDWGLVNLPILIDEKRRRNKEFIIPDEFLRKIAMANNNIKRSMEEKNEKVLKRKLEEEEQKIDASQISKMKYRYCMACRLLSDELEIEHPIFKGCLCNNCFINGKDIILSIAKDKSNDGCCVCLTGQKGTLVLCTFCVRAYCKECLEFYCEQIALNLIKNVDSWTCFACDVITILLKTGNLVPRSTEEQLKNIYNLYPAKTKKNYAKQQIHELHVMNLKDIQNNVPKALQNLDFPFKILETSYFNENIKDSNENIAKLVIQYYPNNENYNKDKFFDQSDCMKKFFSFLLFKNKMEALQSDGKPIFWAFETSAAIKIAEQRTISRFLNTQPIIIGMLTNDVQQRSRFIWTNITILNVNIKQLTNQNIYLHKIPKHSGKRSKFYKDNIDMPWCYSSIYTILSSLIKNDIVF